ncbi:hypothetical protein ACFOY4_33515 [Actinomadura syzygii]|uniref:Uncharacterized protein n=1 Tax=Actinomadura syzygii TaxID=1427538 RepID=A0A5D0UD42_9ACTN|nr:hypothetical protein [Actinomadura syzygii]TYC15019.1 hypothetical protein FXF65_12895 [Actinomadura syzygii]
MPVPDVIPIKHEPDFHADTIGTYQAGQFFASVTGAYPKDHVPGPDWQTQMRWYAVLHRFDPAGFHAGSEIWSAGRNQKDRRDATQRAQAKLTEWLTALPDRTYGDIAIRPFQLVVDEITFGLLIEKRRGRRTWAELHPQGLGFASPWDGLYST